jgi:hypothetical protein
MKASYEKVVCQHKQAANYLSAKEVSDFLIENVFYTFMA